MDKQIKKAIEMFFRISNAIEGLIDENETLACVKFFEKVKNWNYKKAMFYFHNKMGYLNNYCIAGRLRDYPVFVGGRKCLDFKLIEKKLKLLFSKKPETFKEIKQWHIEFEKIHPFGDGNGRMGRFLMLIQAERNKIKLPDMFFTMDNFEENRQKYYKWFK